MTNVNRQIRILHIVSGVNGGVGMFLYNYYRHIDHQKVHFDLMAISTGNKHAFSNSLQGLGADVYLMPKNYLKRLIFLFKFLSANEYDIVHSHIELPSAIYLLLAKWTGVKVRIAHAHMAFLNYTSLKNRALRYLLNTVSTHKWGCSTDALNGLFGAKYADRKNVIYNAIEIEQYIYNEDIRKEYREMLGVEDKFVMGFVGRLCPPKNIHYLTEIFYEVKKLIPHAVFLVCGDGELREQMLKQIARLGIKDDVMMLGNRNDVNKLMQAMDVFVLPSLWEGLGIVLIEAQAASLHCVAAKNTIPLATKITDYIDYIDLREPPRIWAEFISEHCCEYKRKNTHEHIAVAHYDIKAEAKRLEKIYLNLVN